MEPYSRQCAYFDNTAYKTLCIHLTHGGSLQMNSFSVVFAGFRPSHPPRVRPVVAERYWQPELL